MKTYKAKSRKRLNMYITGVAEYSPLLAYEFDVEFMLSLNQKGIRAQNRVMEQNFLLGWISAI